MMNSKAITGEDRVKGAVQVEQYAGTDFAVDDEYAIDAVLFDTLLVHLEDGSLEEKSKGGIIVPTAVSGKVWRTGKVILAGTGSRTIKTGDYVIFPNDKGITTKAVTIQTSDGVEAYTECVFIAEDRIFARAKKVNEQ